MLMSSYCCGEVLCEQGRGGGGVCCRRVGGRIELTLATKAVGQDEVAEVVVDAFGLGMAVA